MVGILEAVLIKRYGEPKIEASGPLTKKFWSGDSSRPSVVYCCADWDQPPASEFTDHRAIYGACCGGSLIGGALKLAMLSRQAVFGIYQIQELIAQPEVKRANELDSDIAFFMDASNVWFYGHKTGSLFVFDSATEELDELGPIDIELARLIEEWEAARVTN